MCYTISDNKNDCPIIGFIYSGGIILIRFKNFSRSAQMLADKAVFCAEKTRSNYLGSEHFFWSFLTFETAKGKEFLAAGITPDVVYSQIESMINKNPSLQYTGEATKNYLTVDNFSEELQECFDIVDENRDVLTSYIEWTDIIDAMYNKPDSSFSILRDKLIKKRDTLLPPALAKFGKNLTDEADNGNLAPVIGRTEEIDRLIHILLRKNKRNACIIGEAGVGKTAIVEGLAQRIANDEVPLRLRNKIIYSLNPAALVAGTRYRGDFEERMNSIISQVENNKNIIIFVDEIHTLSKMGEVSEGGSDALNIFKPSLARGSIQLIGTTTTSEYKKTIERDAAFARRLETIFVSESSVEDTIQIMNGLKKSYEDFHGVTIDDEAINACVKLSKRYITDRYLPDKAITLMDETAARLSAIGYDKVTKNDICATIQKSTGINVSELTESDNKKLANIENELNSRVIGQEEAVHVVSKALKRSRVGLRNPNRPIGSFLFVGPTGVGKTELGKAIATYLNGTDKSLIKLDMSEYMEKHSVSKIIGSPPGYVGFDEGGQLTDKVKRNPYSVVIFDEIEKAHPEVCDILLQILDEGSLTDARGTKVDFKNTVIVITSNIGSNLLAAKKSNIGFGVVGNETKNADNKEIVMNAIKEHFRPEFINRIDNIIVFNSLSENVCETIASNMLKEVSDRINEQGYHISFDNSVIKAVVSNGFDEKMGARNLKREIQTLVEDTLSDAIINDEISADCQYTMKCKNGAISFSKKKELVSA